jgi:hypothetical protein
MASQMQIDANGLQRIQAGPDNKMTKQSQISPGSHVPKGLNAALNPPNLRVG